MIIVLALPVLKVVIDKSGHDMDMQMLDFLAGGAMIQFLADETLPGIEALKG